MAELKPGWQRVKFGEVVRLNKETCKDPEAAGIDRVIGLEHLEPGDLRVRSWADVADGTTFTNRVRPGQVLFGKRRAYQRKVAVADFDAVCSGDIYVLESADQERLLPGLLPFICQTDAFFEHAVGTSAGSLSPRTNWGSLADYEFSLPPLHEQQNAIDLVQSAMDLSHQIGVAQQAAEALGKAYANHILSPASLGNLPMTKLGKVCKRVGVGIAASASHAYRSSGVPFIRNTNIKAGRIDHSDMFHVDPLYARQHQSKALSRGDIVMTRTATDTPGDAAVVPEDLDGAQAFTVLVCTPKHDVVDSYFLCEWINSPQGRSFIRTRR
jgi:type I restriction enzyme S subunit